MIPILNYMDTFNVHVSSVIFYLLNLHYHNIWVHLEVKFRIRKCFTWLIMTVCTIINLQKSPTKMFLKDLGIGHLIYSVNSVFIYMFYFEKTEKVADISNTVSSRSTNNLINIHVSDFSVPDVPARNSSLQGGLQHHANNNYIHLQVW